MNRGGVPAVFFKFGLKKDGVQIHEPNTDL